MSTRLERWMDDEVALMERELGPMGGAEEAGFREALGKTLHAAQLQLADNADAFAGVASGLGDRVLATLKEVSDAARDRSLREWFRSHW